MVHNRRRRPAFLDVYCEVRGRWEIGGWVASSNTVIQGQRVGCEGEKGMLRAEGK